MLKLLILVGAITLLGVSASPYGEKFLASLTPEQRQSIRRELLEDALLDVPELIVKYGYPMESHEVQTEDGYLVTMHRIPGRKVNPNGPGTPVFLMHGLLSSSADWVINGPKKALGYILADEGYDVWMGNARGNYYSRKHVSIDPDVGGDFWHFSWHEIGYYDVPACIDYILRENGNSKLHYIGHSQGTAVFFVMASTRPQYNEKVALMQAMAPVSYVSNLRSPFIKFVAPLSPYLEILGPLYGVYETMPSSENTQFLAKYVCNEESLFLGYCTGFIGLLGGSDPEQLNVTMLPVYICHTPAGASMRQQYHFSQNYLSGKFRQYDYGLAGNLLHYGTPTPPDYQLNKITAPVALHIGANDILAVEEDADILYSELANPVGKYIVPFPLFNHLDFIWAIDAPTLLYNHAQELMRQYPVNP